MYSLQEKIEKKLQVALQPTYLKVVNQSIYHAGHAGDDGSGESHFKIEIAAKNLEKLSRINAQKEIYSILEEEMKIIHALSIQVKT